MRVITPLRLASLAAAASLVLGTTACGGGPGGAAGEVKGDTITIGAILSMSGAYSTLGPPEKVSMEMGVKALNDKGGVTIGDKKYKLALKVVDDKSDAATAGVAAYRDLATVDNAPVVAIGLGSASYSSVIDRNPMPVINVLDSTSPSILQYSDHLFLLRTDTPGYAPGCTWHAKNVGNAKTMAIIGASADPYSVGLVDWVKKSANEYGLNISAESNYPAGTTDFGPFIDQVMRTKPDSIYLGGVTAEVLPVLKQLRQSGITVPVYHSSGVTPDQAKNILGQSLFSDMMKDNYDCAGTLPITSTDQRTLDFAKAYQQATGDIPQDLTMWAYDYPFIVAKAMEQAGTATDREKIYQTLNTMEVPADTISGWKAQNGKLFGDRKAITPSQIMAWCPDQQSIKPTLTFDMDGLKVINQDLVKEPCKS